MSHPLASEAALRRAQAAELRRKADTLDAQAEGMEYALQYIPTGARVQSSTLAVVGVGTQNVAQVLEAMRPAQSNRTRARRVADSDRASSGGRVPGAISHRWQDVLKGLHDLGAPFTAQDVTSMIDMLEGRVMKPSAVRRHFELYIKQGFVTLDGGKYSIAPLAVERFDLVNRIINEPEGSKAIEPLNGIPASGPISGDYQSPLFSHPAHEAQR